MRRKDPEIRAVLAGEYVLGTLQGGARQRFEQELETDPALRAEVEHWEQALFRLLHNLPEQAPPEQVWRRVQAEIGAERAQSAAHPPSRVGLWESLGFWRGWSVTATIAAVALGIALVLAPAASSVTYVVVVTDDARSQASWVLTGHADSQSIRVRTLAPQPLPDARAFQLWVLPAGERTVRPVALIPASGETEIPVSESIAAAISNAQKLGVSIEAPGGSPTGQPTTTPLYHGTPLAL